ncbi:MAG: POTRA domain-containing protein, partial [Kofleriaceae bacterium]
MSVAATALADPLIERIGIAGNHRVEADAIQLQISSRPGQLVDPTRLRADVHAIWKLGLFDDVRVVTEDLPSGAARVTFEVEERPSIRKVLVAGNRELGLDKINDVLDLKRGVVVDIKAVQRDRDRIAARYLEEGFSLATVDYSLAPAGPGEVDVTFRVDEHAKILVSDVKLVGNRAVSDRTLRGLLATRPPNALAFLNDSGTYRRDALERDLAVVTAHYWDAGYATIKVAPPALELSRDKRRMHVTISIEEGPRFAFGKV